ncbi:hypothetical protein ACFL6C_01940 [Myxococcota bacterium]
MRNDRLWLGSLVSIASAMVVSCCDSQTKPSRAACDQDEDGFLSLACGGADCNDEAAHIHPRASETEKWLKDTVDTNVAGGTYTSLLLDTAGALHVAYVVAWWTGFEWSDGELRYATNVSGAWTWETVETQLVRGISPSIVMSTTGTVHISYLDWTTGELRLLTKEDPGWDGIVIHDQVEYYSTLRLDSDGRFHLAYRQGPPTTGHLWYATNRSGQWIRTMVDEEENTGSFASMALDARGSAHISYYAVGPQAMRYATNVTGSWEVTTVDAVSPTGFFTSLAVDGEGIVHISYQSHQPYQLHHAMLEEGLWSIETVDATSVGVSDTSIALDEEGAPHIAYQAFRSALIGELRCATNRDAGWTVEVADAVGSTGFFPSMVIQNNVAHICYASEEHLYCIRRSVPDGLDNDCDGDAL